MRVLSSFRDSGRTVAAATPQSGRIPIASDREIRVLELLSGELTWPLECRLHVQALSVDGNLNPEVKSESSASAEDARPAQPTPKPRHLKYQALSYTWGSWDDAHTITVDRTPVKITRNLWEALRCLRRRYRVRFLWVDQICIDQSDTNERNHQVRLMKQVYQQAATVLIWLGDWIGHPDYRKDFQRAMGVFDRARERYRRDTATSDAQHAYQGEEQTLASNNDSNNTPDIRQPQWYTRGWVVQEAVLATHDPIICVSRWELSAEKFLASANSTSPLTVGLRSILEYRKLPEESRTLLRFASILFETNVSEPRDKIYSLLGLITPEESRLIAPDYSADLSVVFQQATYASINANDNLGILSLVLDQRSEVPNLPSWAVDFGLDSSRKPARRNGKTRGGGSGGSSNDSTAHRDIRRLTAKHDLDHFAQIPRIWCPQQQSRRPRSFLDIAQGTLRVLGLIFDVIAHSIPLDTLRHIIDTTAYGSLAVPIVSASRNKCSSEATAESSRAIEGMTPKRWLAARKTRHGRGHGQDIAIPLPILRVNDSTVTDDGNDNARSTSTSTSPSPSTTLPKPFHHWLKTYLQSTPDPHYGSSASPQPWMNYFLTTAGDHLHARVLVSQHRFVGLGPKGMRGGDVIALVYGAPAPMILRKREREEEKRREKGKEEEERWRFVGFAYVYGIMAHELMDTPELQFEEVRFVLS